MKLPLFFRKKPWLSVVAIIYVAGMIAVSVPKSMDITEDSDYYAWWQAGKDFSEKHTLYYRFVERPFNYPPFAAFVFQPLQIFPLQISALLYFLLNALVLLPIAIYLIYRILKILGYNEKNIEMVLILATLFTLKYFWNNLVMYQVNFVQFIGMLLGFYFLARKKPHLAGILFVIISFVKIIPVILAAYVFVFHFSKRVVVSMALTAAICLTLPMAFRGADNWITDHEEYYEWFISTYIKEGRIVADRANHSLVAGTIKTFHPASRDNEHVYPGDYPVTTRIISIIHMLLLAMIIVNGILLFRRKTGFSLTFLASILLFTHLYSGITWTAHMVTLLFCLLPVLLIDVKTLGKPGRISWWLFIAMMVFLGIEGSDTVGEKIYLAIRFHDVYTLLLLGLFLFCSWMVFNKNSYSFYREGIVP